jgi:hypothetical protein
MPGLCCHREVALEATSTHFCHPEEHLLSLTTYCDAPHRCHSEDEQPDFRTELPDRAKSGAVARMRNLVLGPRRMPILHALGCNLGAGTADTSQSKWLSQ